ncbi:hypothetical protein HUT16_14455 [Kitasatospora sp. NA04385]|uniref:hypothetical protein n=1 Tax=Kitasatospora sp. NA04385 TaxID=2742135 RepID=UPI001590F093|nr:hypothetical protein [Kitasatospora sp. NA04385]QKW20106.1 hypothetical protein HUT16_14455 [Kitasatospora sp. NA04385]
MHINRSAHAGRFTVLPNQLLQNSDLHCGPRGLLGFLLSLPDGRWMPAEEMARHSGESLNRIRKYLRDLAAAGYYAVRRVRIAQGHIISVQHVTDVPWQFPSAQVAPTVREPESGSRELLKTKNQEQGTPLPPLPPEPPAGPHAEPPAEPAAGPPAEPHAEPAAGPPAIPRQRTRTAPRPPAPIPVLAPALAPAPVPAPVLDGRMRTAADALLRVVRREPRLRIGEAEAARLAPLVARWIDRGSTPADLAAALLPGLPEQVHFPGGLLRRRLTDKLPAVLTPPAPAPTCPACHDPVPRPGPCPPCTQAPPSAPVTPGTGATLAREALRRARAATC